MRLDSSAEPEAIAASVSEVLNEPGYRQAAERIAAVIADETAKDQAVGIELLIEDRAPGPTPSAGEVLGQPDPVGAARCPITGPAPPPSASRVIAASVHHAVDEQGGRAPYLTRRPSPLSTSRLTRPSTAALTPIGVERRERRARVRRRIAEGRHPRARPGGERAARASPRTCLGAQRPRRRRMRRGRADGSRSAESGGTRSAPRRPTERSTRSISRNARSRVRALVVAVLDEEATRGRAADVVDRIVERLHRDLGAFHRQFGDVAHA